MEKLAATLVVLVLLMVGVDAIFAQDPLIPAEIPGEVVFIPFPISLMVDGDLADWATIPAVTLTQAPISAARDHGAFVFQLAADTSALYLALSVTHPTLPPITSSFALYLNLTTDLNALTYGAGIAQLIITPSSSSLGALSVTGINSERLRVEGIAFTTPAGWGFEAAIPLDQIFVPSNCDACQFPPPQDNTPVHGREIGLQAIGYMTTANGTPVESRWATHPLLAGEPPAPATFGRGIYFELGQSDILRPVLAPHPPPIPTIDWASVMDALNNNPAAIHPGSAAH